jgi:hypothetical protein
MKKPYIHNVMASLILVALFAFVLVSCGGGSADGGAASTDITYTGLTSMAVINESSAQDLAVGAYAGILSSSAINVSGAVQINETRSDGICPAFQVAFILEYSLKYFNIGKGQNGNIVGATISDSITFYGNCGGNAVYTIEVDDQTGRFTGHGDYNNYCEDGVTISGPVDVSGQADINTGEIVKFTLTFNRLTSTYDDVSLTIKGSISGDYTVTPVVISMDMLIRDNYSGKVYWMENYRMTVIVGPNYIEFELSGRFYSPDHGYVDIVTDSPFLKYNAEENPSEGILVILGSSGPSGGNAKAVLTILSNTSYLVELDSNDDGLYDWSSGGLCWENKGLCMSEFEIVELMDANSDTTLPGRPAIGFDGTNYLLVTYRDFVEPVGLIGITISITGQILNSFQITEVEGSPHSVAFDGTNYLVVYHNEGQIFATRVTPAGIVLDGATGFSVASSTSVYPTVAFDGVNYLIVWGNAVDNNYDIFGARVTPEGTVLGEFLVFSAPGEQIFQSIAFGGSNYLVVWQDTRGSGDPEESEIYGARVSPEGVVLDPGGIAICTAPGHQGNPYVTFGGGNYLVVWNDDPEPGSPTQTNIFGARVAPSGALLDGPPDIGAIPISVSPIYREMPSATYDGNVYIVAYPVGSYANSPPAGIYVKRIASDGVLIDSPSEDLGIEISGVPPNGAKFINPGIVFGKENPLIAWVNNVGTIGASKSVIGGAILRF